MASLSSLSLLQNNYNFNFNQQQNYSLNFFNANNNNHSNENNNNNNNNVVNQQHLQQLRSLQQQQQQLETQQQAQQQFLQNVCQLQQHHQQQQQQQQQHQSQNFFRKPTSFMQQQQQHFQQQVQQEQRKYQQQLQQQFCGSLQSSSQFEKRRQLQLPLVNSYQAPNSSFINSNSQQQACRQRNLATFAACNNDMPSNSLSSFISGKDKNNNNDNNNNNNNNNNIQLNLESQHNVNITTDCNTNNNKNTEILDDKFSMDATEIANFLAKELYMNQLASVDGIQSGVPTLTTSTLTPTTLRSIEDVFSQLVAEPVNAPNQAGFIPPSFPTGINAAGSFNGSVYESTESDGSEASWDGNQINDENSMATTDNSSAATDSTSFPGLSDIGNSSLAATSNHSNDFSGANFSMTAAVMKKLKSNSQNSTSNSATTGTPGTTRRNQGGRRPAKASNLSPEEEEKRRIRRERNKLAAARCRKRRVDLTNELQGQVSDLEKRREGLENEVKSLSGLKADLELALNRHKLTCGQKPRHANTVNTFSGIIAPTTSNSSDGECNSAISGIDTSLASAAGCSSPVDYKPIILNNTLLDVQNIKDEPPETMLDSNSLDDDGPTSPKRVLLSDKNPILLPPLSLPLQLPIPLPKISTFNPAFAAASSSLNTPIVSQAPVSFSSYTGNSLLNKATTPGAKQRPNSLPTMPRHLPQNLALNMDNNKAATDINQSINGVAIQTPSTGMFNFDSLMDGGTGLTPVSGPLVPTCSSQNKHPLELTTPTSEPSKLVSL